MPVWRSVYNSLKNIKNPIERQKRKANVEYSVDKILKIGKGFRNKGNSFESFMDLIMNTVANPSPLVLEKDSENAVHTRNAYLTAAGLMRQQKRQRMGTSQVNSKGQAVPPEMMEEMYERANQMDTPTTIRTKTDREDHEQPTYVKNISQKEATTKPNWSRIMGMDKETERDTSLQDDWYPNKHEYNPSFDNAFYTKGEGLPSADDYKMQRLNKAGFFDIDAKTGRHNNPVQLKGSAEKVHKGEDDTNYDYSNYNRFPEEKEKTQESESWW